MTGAVLSADVRRFVGAPWGGDARIRKVIRATFMKDEKVTFAAGFAIVRASDCGGGLTADDPTGCAFQLQLARGQRVPLRGASSPSVAGLGRKLGNPETEFSRP